MSNPFKYFNSSPEVIRLVVMMCVRYPLSLRNVEDQHRGERQSGRVDKRPQRGVLTNPTGHETGKNAGDVGLVERPGDGMGRSFQRVGLAT